MAKKPPPPPSSSSSEEEENESSSSDDEEEKQQIPSKPAPQTPSKPDSDDSETDASDSGDSEPAPQMSQSAPSKPAPESESRSESGSESKSDPGSAKLVPPVSSKPRAPPAESEGPVVKSGDNKNVNCNKINLKPLFQRIWSLDDEIAILESIAEYQSEHGQVKAIPGAIGGFCDFVKGRLSFEATSTQLADKIRRLKRKYSSTVDRARGGRAMKFARSHDKKIYDLSEKLWGQGNEEDGKKGKKVAEVGPTVSGRGRKGKRKWPLLRETLRSMGNKMVVSELLEGVDGKKAGVWERKLKKQKGVELKHQISRANLIKESIKLVLEGLKRAPY